jgi:hypothetical protein
MSAYTKENENFFPAAMFNDNVYIAKNNLTFFSLKKNITWSSLLFSLFEW